MTTPGSAAAFDAFYWAENERLLRYYRKRVGRDAAPDLIQEAFTRLLRSGALERVECPQAYLYQIAHNLLIERTRQWRRKLSALCPLDEARDAAVPPDQMRRIEEIDIRRILRPMLLAMPPKTRRILLMSRLRQQTYNEIAEELGIGEKAVEYHLAKAMARCRKAVTTRW